MTQFVTNDVIATGAVNATSLASDAVVTAKILNANVTPAKLSQPFTQGDGYSTITGTEFDFNNIPSWATRIILTLDRVSVNGTANLRLRLGTATAFETTGYTSITSNLTNTTASTDGIDIRTAVAAGNFTGHVWLTTVGSNYWVASINLASNAGPHFAIGTAAKQTADTLTRIKLTTTNGTDVFDLGLVKIAYD